MVDESASGSASPKSESHAHTRAHALARGGVLRRKDRHVEERRSLVDAKVPPGARGGGVVSRRWSSR